MIVVWYGKLGIIARRVCVVFDFKRSGFNCRDEERQSGELWQFNAFGGSPRYEEGELSGNEDGVRLPLEKKRRLSPIVLGE
ncbi:hypothetical protein OIU74_016935, partial [Salix koriyanagi]